MFWLEILMVDSCSYPQLRVSDWKQVQEVSSQPSGNWRQGKNSNWCAQRVCTLFLTFDSLTSLSHNVQINNIHKIVYSFHQLHSSNYNFNLKFFISFSNWIFFLSSCGPIRLLSPPFHRENKQTNNKTITSLTGTNTVNEKLFFFANQQSQSESLPGIMNH